MAQAVITVRDADDGGLDVSVEFDPRIDHGQSDSPAQRFGLRLAKEVLNVPGVEAMADGRPL